MGSHAVLSFSLTSLTANLALNFMTPSVFIRQALASDLPSIIRLDALSNPYPWGEALVVDALQTRRNWVIESVSESVNASANSLADNVLGWLTASAIFDQSELELIVIDSAVRRQGLARKLMIVWLEAAAQQGACELLLEVRESNLGAISLYESLGFELVGRRKNYYQIAKKGQIEQGHEAACLFTLKMNV
jgi:ribosomal-protein-alanine N-acetyltransferase